MSLPLSVAAKDGATRQTKLKVTGKVIRVEQHKDKSGESGVYMHVGAKDKTYTFRLGSEVLENQPKWIPGENVTVIGVSIPFTGAATASKVVREKKKD